MIKYINAFIIGSVIILGGFIFYNKFFRYTDDLPVFTYNVVKNNLSFTNNDIPKNRETIIAYVSVLCGSCENTIKAIDKNLDPDKTYIIVTSERNRQTSENFFDKLSLDQRIILLNDPNNNFTKDFNLGFSTVYPTILIFDSKNKLTKITHSF